MLPFFRINYYNYTLSAAQGGPREDGATSRMALAPVRWIADHQRQSSAVSWKYAREIETSEHVMMRMIMTRKRKPKR